MKSGIDNRRKVGKVLYKLIITTLFQKQKVKNYGAIPNCVEMKRVKRHGINNCRDLWDDSEGKSFTVELSSFLEPMVDEDTWVPHLAHRCSQCSSTYTGTQIITSSTLIIVLPIKKTLMKMETKQHSEENLSVEKTWSLMATLYEEYH